MTTSDYNTSSSTVGSFHIDASNPTIWSTLTTSHYINDHSRNYDSTNYNDNEFEYKLSYAMDEINELIAKIAKMQSEINKIKETVLGSYDI